MARAMVFTSEAGIEFGCKMKQNMRKKQAVMDRKYSTVSFLSSSTVPSIG